MKTFLFLDIETTGLRWRQDVVLEVAWAFTDEHFEVLGEPRSFVVKPEDHEWATIASQLRKNDIPRQMHQSSGLYDELPMAEHDILDIRKVMRADIEEQLQVGAAIHLAGLSVEFDRTFLDELHDFEFEEMGVHHRLYNLSAVKLALDNVGVVYYSAKPGNHRALADVFEAIEQARIFRELLGHLPAV